jgi:hypothetical protein
VGRFHDGADLFQIVHIEGWNAVAVLGGVIEKLTQTDECHG